MAAVLVTGMSGVGKSTVLAELARRGHRVVDTDDPGWVVDVVPDGGGEPEPLWDPDRMDALLAGHTDGTLFVGGCVANQGRFSPGFDAVVLLSAPLDVVLERIAVRTGNDFGKAPAERARVVRDVALVEPLLRVGATAEIDTRVPLTQVADRLEEIAGVGPGRR
jgi:broad-specificity NMP kinase